MLRSPSAWLGLGLTVLLSAAACSESAKSDDSGGDAGATGGATGSDAAAGGSRSGGASGSGGEGSGSTPSAAGGGASEDGGSSAGGTSGDGSVGAGGSSSGGSSPGDGGTGDIIGSCYVPAGYQCAEYFFQPNTPYPRDIQYTTAQVTCGGEWSDSGCSTDDLIGWCGDTFTKANSYFYTGAGPADSLAQACATGLQGTWHPG